jgi:ABC-type multidrug transport system permease subunit
MLFLLILLLLLSLLLLSVVDANEFMETMEEEFLSLCLILSFVSGCMMGNEMLFL